MRTVSAILLLISVNAQGQFNNYQSLQAPFGARSAALGGKAVSLADGDLMQFSHNPAVLDSVESGEIGVNFSPYFADIYSFTGAWMADLNYAGNVSFGLTYLNYGTFVETTDSGDELGEFNAYDYVISMGKSHRIGSFSIGGTIKFASNGYIGYNSSLLVADLGGIYRSPISDFTVGLVLKNFGFVLRDYTGRSGSNVPFDVLLGTSIKPEHMPFRFTITAFNLLENELYFEEQNNISTSKTVKIADKIFRRVNLGAELIIHKNVQFLLGYSHLRRQELKLAQSAYGSGFSYGLIIGIKQFEIQYAHETYHAAGGTDYFTIQTNLNSFKKIL